LQTSISFPKNINLILSGGAFNGSYMLGVLYYLKELERKGKIRIHKISGSSIGSILGLLYLADRLDLFNELYLICVNDLMEKLNLSKLLELKEIIQSKLPDNICETVHKRLYISYHNIQFGEKHVKNKYKNTDELLDCITRSCYLPFFINYNSSYKNKYIDGMMPFFFKNHKNTEKYKNLYINIFTHDKIYYSMEVKNERTNLHRVLTGINDIHIFFIKNKNTVMCSYTDKWTTYEHFMYYLYMIIERILLYFMYSTKDIYNMKVMKPMIKECTRYILSTFSL